MIDLLVVGGGPAGLATAIHGARAGLDVAVVERRRGSVDKACGEGLMPHTLRHLERLAVYPYGKPIRGISYWDGEQHVDAKFRPGNGRGVRRTVLHGALIDAAVGAGVEIHHDEIRGISQDADSVARDAGGRAISPRPTVCTPPSADPSAWSNRVPARGAGVSAVTCKPRRGRTTSRCTGH